MIEEKIRADIDQIFKQAQKTGSLPRQAAIALAEERVKTAMA